MARLKLRNMSFGLTLMGSAAITAIACSDSSGEELAAAGVSQGCTLNSDCSAKLVCAFQRCHAQCEESRDCPGVGQRCVKEGGGSGGASGKAEGGVCQLPVEKSCSSSGDECPTGQECAEDNQCHDVCHGDDDCLANQLCTPSGACADRNVDEIDESGNIAPSGSGGAGDGTGGKGGKGGSGVRDGHINGLGGDDGGPLVNECPDTMGDNPEEHQYESLADDVSWSGLHHVQGTLYLTGTLELGPCTVVQLDGDAQIYVTTNGSIRALGLPTRPVVFTSSKSPPAPGDWAGIRIQEVAANDSVFQNVIVEYGGANYSAVTVDNGARASFSNVLFRHTAPNQCAINLASGATVATFQDVETQDSNTSLCVGANTIGSIGSFTTDSKGIKVQAETISTDATWKDFGVPYLMGGSWYVSAELKVDPGVDIWMPSGGYIYVNDGGALKAVGTADKKVTFTSAKASADAGDWQYINFQGTASNDSVLEHTVVEYGAGSSVVVSNGASLGVINTTFQHSDDDGGCALTWNSDARITDFEGVEFLDTPCPISVPASLVRDLGTLTTDGTDITVAVETITTPQVWTDHGTPYRLSGSMYVNASWQIGEGVTIKMPSNAYLIASSNGSFNVLGTEDKPVTFRSFIDDAADGDWQYIQIQATSANNHKFNHTIFQDAAKALIVEGRKVTLDSCTFQNNTCDIQDRDMTVTGADDFTACP